MKPTNILLALSLVLGASLACHAQVGIGTSSPNAALDVTSTTNGFLPPRMSAVQRNAIATPAQGLMIYCTDCGTGGQAQVYNGTAWVNMIGGEAFPIGSVIAYLGNSGNVAGMESNGWFKCDGRAISGLSALSADEKTALTNILGNSSNLPNLMGVFLRGLDENSSGVQDDDRGTRTDGENHANGSGTGVRSKQDENYRSHNHTGSSASTDGNHSHNFTDYYASIPSGTLANSYYYTGSSFSTYFSPSASLASSTLSAGDHTHTITVASQGGNETRPDNIAVYWLIRGR
jgi:hypothetical protein